MDAGKLIVIEGTDCSGKATQTKLLIERLNDEDIAKCHHISFPRYKTPTGKIVGECYLGKDLGSGGGSWFEDANSVDPKIASLYYAADRRAALPEMESILLGGQNIISDRYVTSNMGHQGGKIKDSVERLGFIEWLHYLEYNLLCLPEPDSVVFLHMPYKIGMELKKSRKGKADSHESNPEHLRNAEQAYLELADMYEWVRVDCAPDGTFDSLRGEEDIHEEVFGIARKILEK
jgi:dTMP kinase